MNIELKLEVQANEFWSIITESLIQDIGEDVVLRKGLEFEKKLPTTLSGVATAKVEIVEFELEKSYGADFKTSRSTVHSRYDIKELEDGILVSYSEDETFFSTLDNWNAKIMKTLYKKSRTKKLVRKLKAIEAHIKGGR